MPYSSCAGIFAALLHRLLASGRGDSEKAFWGLTVAFVLFVGFTHGIYRNLKVKDVSYVERAVTHMLSPGTPLYTDVRTAWLLRFFWSYPTQTATHDFSGMQAGDIPPGAYVLLNPKRVEIVLHYGYRPPPFFESPPVTWLQRWESAPARLYLVPRGDQALR